MFYSFWLYFPLMPKPRGMQNAAGRIYHSSKPYKEYTAKVIESVKDTVIYERLGDPIKHEFCVGLFNGYMQTKGAQPDLDNLAGGILDSLKKAGLIYDDNRKYWDTIYGKANWAATNKNLFIICDERYEQKMIDIIRLEKRQARIQQRLLS